jgi:hypothetical protein
VAMVAMPSSSARELPPRCFVGAKQNKKAWVRFFSSSFPLFSGHGSAVSIQLQIRHFSKPILQTC